MRICIVTPAPPRTRLGNRVTAERWAGFLQQLGHRVNIQQHFAGDEECDVLVALHAKRSARDITRFHRLRPDAPLLVALTGTDLYRDIHRFATARKSLELATRLILLQPHGRLQLPQELHAKIRVIYQSVVPPTNPPPPLKGCFEVVVIGHLRSVKDPFRAALAARDLPVSSKVRIVQLGGCLTPAMEARARRETESNARYRWLGDRSRKQTLRRLARSRLLVLSSKMEGGANVVSEAIAVSTPVISTNVSGSIGLLGDDYPGYFDVGDTQGLRDLLYRAETDSEFYTELESRCSHLQPLVDPARELDCWRRLLSE